MYPNEWLFSANAEVLYMSVCMDIYLICVYACMCEKEGKERVFLCVSVQSLKQL